LPSLTLGLLTRVVLHFEISCRAGNVERTPSHVRATSCDFVDRSPSPSWERAAVRTYPNHLPP